MERDLNNSNGDISKSSAPLQLPDLSFEVTKFLNSWKRYTQRTIVLTAKGIQNVRRNGEVSSVNPYDKIKRIAMKDVETFVINYEDGKHDYIYSSPIGMQIVQEIKSRMKLLQDKKKLRSTNDYSKVFQEKLIEEERKDQQVSHTTTSNNNTTTKHNHTPEGESARTRASTRVRKAIKLSALLGDSEEQRIEQYLSKIIMDTSTREGKAVAQMNSAHISENTATLPLNMQQFLLSLRESIMQNYLEQLKKLMIQTAESNDPNKNAANSTSLASVIWSSLERLVLVRQHTRIWRAIKSTTHDTDDLIARKKTAILCEGCAGLLSDVPEQFRHIQDWQIAIADLNDVDKSVEPSQKLTAILDAARAIYDSVRLRYGHVILSGDDFLPIFIYVVVNSDLRDLETTANYIWSLSEPEALSGEGGYYLTVFCSAIEFIKSFDPSSTNTSVTASTTSTPRVSQPPSPRAVPSIESNTSESSSIYQGAMKDLTSHLRTPL